MLCMLCYVWFFLSLYISLLSSQLMALVVMLIIHFPSLFPPSLLCPNTTTLKSFLISTSPPLKCHSRILLGTLYFCFLFIVHMCMYNTCQSFPPPWPYPAINLTIVDSCSLTFSGLLCYAICSFLPSLSYPFLS